MHCGLAARTEEQLVAGRRDHVYELLHGFWEADRGGVAVAEDVGAVLADADDDAAFDPWWRVLAMAQVWL